jgi:hypothetical protein
MIWWCVSIVEVILTINADQAAQAEVPYPGIALFQKTSWSAQANLLAGKSKCFLGWYDDTSPICTSINSSSINPSTSCNCRDIWSNTVTENFTFQDGVYRYLEFPTALKLNCTTPTTLLWLQAFFDCIASIFPAILPLLTAFQTTRLKPTPTTATHPLPASP